VLPAVIVLQDSSARYWIAGISLAILLTAITWSKRQPSVGAISGEPVEPAKV
jgi:hypothetical protein